MDNISRDDPIEVCGMRIYLKRRPGKPNHRMPNGEYMDIPPKLVPAVKFRPKFMQTVVKILDEDGNIVEPDMKGYFDGENDEDETDF